jgi:hypothetical protein
VAIDRDGFMQACLEVNSCARYLHVSAVQWGNGKWVLRDGDNPARQRQPGKPSPEAAWLAGKDGMSRDFNSLGAAYREAASLAKASRAYLMLTVNEAFDGWDEPMQASLAQHRAFQASLAAAGQEVAP